MKAMLVAALGAATMVAGCSNQGPGRAPAGAPMTTIGSIRPMAAITPTAITATVPATASVAWGRATGSMSVRTVAITAAATTEPPA